MARPETVEGAGFQTIENFIGRSGAGGTRSTEEQKALAQLLQKKFEYVRPASGDALGESPPCRMVVLCETLFKMENRAKRALGVSDIATFELVAGNAHNSGLEEFRHALNVYAALFALYARANGAYSFADFVQARLSPQESFEAGLKKLDAFVSVESATGVCLSREQLDPFAVADKKLPWRSLHGRNQVLKELLIHFINTGEEGEQSRSMIQSYADALDASIILYAEEWGGYALGIHGSSLRQGNYSAVLRGILSYVGADGGRLKPKTVREWAGVFFCLSADYEQQQGADTNPGQSEEYKQTLDLAIEGLGRVLGKMSWYFTASVSYRAALAFRTANVTGIPSFLEGLAGLVERTLTSASEGGYSGNVCATFLGSYIELKKTHLRSHAFGV